MPKTSPRRRQAADPQPAHATGQRGPHQGPARRDRKLHLPHPLLWSEGRRERPAHPHRRGPHLRGAAGRGAVLRPRRSAAGAEEAPGADAAEGLLLLLRATRATSRWCCSASAPWRRTGRAAGSIPNGKPIAGRSQTHHSKKPVLHRERVLRIVTARSASLSLISAAQAATCRGNAARAETAHRDRRRRGGMSSACAISATSSPGGA